MGILLRRPDLLYQVDRRMQEDELPRLSPADFQHAGHQAILRLFQESVDQDIAEPLDFVLNSLSLQLMEVADNLLARTSDVDPKNERVLDDLMRGLLTLRRRLLDQEVEFHRYTMLEAQDKGDPRSIQDAETMVQLTRVRQRVDKSLQKYTTRLQNTRS